MTEVVRLSTILLAASWGAGAAGSRHHRSHPRRSRAERPLPRQAHPDPPRALGRAAGALRLPLGMNVTPQQTRRARARALRGMLEAIVRPVLLSS